MFVKNKSENDATMMQASEYLYGEGGIVHNVATAQFLITWEEDGTPKVLKWWIEEAEDG